jgi:propionyl-CoA carboxylase beta chain
MGARGAVGIHLPCRLGDSGRSQRERRNTRIALSPFVAAERGYIDDVIMPHATRSRIARALAMLRGKRVEMPARKHDNLPL